MLGVFNSPKPKDSQGPARLSRQRGKLTKYKPDTVWTKKKNNFKRLSKLFNFNILFKLIFLLSHCGGAQWLRLEEAGCLFCPPLSPACHCVSPLFVELHSSTTFSRFYPIIFPFPLLKTPPSSFHTTFHLICPPLHPLTPLHIYSAEKLPICPLASRTLLFCPFTCLVLPFPLSPTSCPYYTLPLAPPTQPNHLFLSSSESHSHLACWNTRFSSPRAGINHSPFHTWQSVLYASDVCMLLEVALLMGSNGDRVMSREPCVCTPSVDVCESRWRAAELTGVHLNFNSLWHINALRFCSYIQKLFSTEKEISLASDWIETLDRAGGYRYAHLPHAGKKEEKWVKSHKAVWEKKQSMRTKRKRKEWGRENITFVIEGRRSRRSGRDRLHCWIA